MKGGGFCTLCIARGDIMRGSGAVEREMGEGG